MKAAIALTVLCLVASASLWLMPVEAVTTDASSVVTVSPVTKPSVGESVEAAPPSPSEAFAWGLGTGVALTSLFLLSAVPRVRHW